MKGESSFIAKKRSAADGRGVSRKGMRGGKKEGGRKGGFSAENCILSREKEKSTRKGGGCFMEEGGDRFASKKNLKNQNPGRGGTTVKIKSTLERESPTLFKKRTS